MLIVIDEDRKVAEVSHTTCSFHQRNPGASYAGCTCSSSYGLRTATPEEYKDNRRRRLTRRRDELRDELAAIGREL
jgi:hypothetical protein